MNTAYKHLEAKLRVGEFTIGQWLGLFVGLMTALVWGFYVSPFGTSITLFTAVYLGGLPAAAIFLATVSDVDILLLVRAAIRWRRTEGRYVAGPGSATNGYVVHAGPPERNEDPNDHQLAELDPAALWES